MERRYLSRKEASRFLAGLGLSIAPSTLAKLASIGGGPPYRRFGRQVKYLASDLIAWAMTRLSGPVRSTSEFDLDPPPRLPPEDDEKPPAPAPVLSNRNETDCGAPPDHG